MFIYAFGTIVIIWVIIKVVNYRRDSNQNNYSSAQKTIKTEEERKSEASPKFKVVEQADTPKVKRINF